MPNMIQIYLLALILSTIKLFLYNYHAIQNCLNTILRILTLFPTLETFVCGVKYKYLKDNTCKYECERHSYEWKIFPVSYTF